MSQPAPAGFFMSGDRNGKRAGSREYRLHRTNGCCKAH